MKTTNTITPLFIILLILGFSILSCGPKPPTSSWDSTVSGDPEAEADFRKARDLFLDNQFGDADERFARLIEQYPNDPLARAATVYRARVSLEWKNPTRARQLLEPLRRDDDPVADRAKLYYGVALNHEKAYEEAIDALKPLLGKMTDLAENALLLRTLWQSARDAGQLEEAFTAIDRFLSMEPDDSDRDDAVNALKEMTATIKSIRRLKKMAGALPTKEYAWPIIMARIAEIHLEAGRFKESADTLEAIEKRRDIADGADGIQELAEEVSNKTRMNLNTIGLLVPLSGRSRLIGETVVKGAMIAAKQTGLNVIIKDSRGDPTRAAQMVEELVEKENVFAIVGPLDVKVARAAAEKADALRIPILLLSVGENLTKTGSFVFRALPTYRAEIEALVKQAKAADIASLGIMYPDTGFGKTVQALTVKTATKQGLPIVSEIAYDNNTTDFHVAAETVSRKKPEAMLILDVAAKVPLIAPALAAAGLWSVKRGEEPDTGLPIQLLVPSFGFSSDLLRRAGRYLNGARFSLYFTPEVTPNSEAFTQKFNIEYGSAPDYLSAFGHDAVIILHGAASNNATNRDDIRTWLVTQSGAEGTALDTTTPFSGFLGSGEPVAGPYIIEIVDGVFQVVSEEEAFE